MPIDLPLESRVVVIPLRAASPVTLLINARKLFVLDLHIICCGSLCLLYTL